MRLRTTKWPLDARGCLLLVACLFAVPQSAQECEELEGNDLTVCLTLMVCMALDEAKARNQCLEVARQVLDQHDAQMEQSAQNPAEEVSEQVTTEPVLVEEVPDLVEQTVDDPVDVEQQTSMSSEPLEGMQSDESTRVEATKPSRVGRLFSWMRRGDGGSAEERQANEEPEVSKDGVPKQFAATVVTVSKAGYNDALVVLSNRYVFIITRARQSRIEPGDVIVARKKEGLSGRQSFLFYGRGASVDARRVDCGHVDPSRQTKRRCEFAARHLGAEAR